MIENLLLLQKYFSISVLLTQKYEYGLFLLTDNAWAYCIVCVCVC